MIKKNIKYIWMFWHRHVVDEIDYDHLHVKNSFLPIRESEIKKVFNQYYVKGTLVEYYLFPFKIFKRKVIYFFYHLRGLYFDQQWKRYLIKKKIRELALSCKKLKR